MKTVDIGADSPDLPSLVEDALAGEEVIFAKDGNPVARLTPIKRTALRQPGAMKGMIWVSDDFDAPLPPDLARAFGAEDRVFSSILT
jgi:antitoxin (DNA-binding transcriptional repressor) of toxin-antitoxin stability system